MKGIIKEYFSWSRSETRSIISVLVILALAMIFKLIIKHNRHMPSFTDQDLYAQVTAFIASCEKIHENEKSHLSSNRIFDDVLRKPETVHGNFNPNTYKLDELIDAGLRKDIAANIIRYRNAGGKFRKPEDIKKIYGMNDSLYQVLSAWILTDLPWEKAEGVEMNTVKHTIPEKSHKIIELNTADTAKLKMIKGIGSVYAARIDGYRNLLGGFYSYNQLFEIYGLDTVKYNNILQYTCLDTSNIKKININEVSEATIRSHPYLDAFHARSIIYYRETAGIIGCLDELTANGVIPVEVFEKCKYYFTLENKQCNPYGSGESEK